MTCTTGTGFCIDPTTDLYYLAHTAMGIQYSISQKKYECFKGIRSL